MKKEVFKKMARIGLAVGFAVGGAIQTAEIVNQHQKIEELRQAIADQKQQNEIDALKKISTEQRLDIMDLKNDTCWDWNFIQQLVLRVAGIPPPGIVDCDTVNPRGHPDALPTPPGSGA